MHEAELIIKHATGQVVRRCNRSIVDSFKECDDFRKAARKMIHWIVSPQFKSCYKGDQESVSKGMKWHPFNVVLGNDTCVAGTNIMYQGLLRSIWALEYFHNSPSSLHDFKSLFLSSSQWDQLSQYESIIRSTQILAMELQTNYPAAIAISSLYVVQNGFSVVETRKVVLSQNEYPWDPKTPLNKLPTCLRLYSNNPNSHGSGNYLTKESCHLVDHFLKEFPNYFSKQETDRDLATMCHPLSAVMGVSILVEMNFGQDLDYYKALLIESSVSFTNVNQTHLWLPRTIPILPTTPSNSCKLLIHLKSAILMMMMMMMIFGNKSIRNRNWNKKTSSDIIKTPPIVH